MKKWFALLSLILLLAACAPENSSAAPEGTMLMLRAETQPLAVGDTVLIATLTDASGNAIDGATLQVHGDMDHAGMVPVDREVSTSSNGEYSIPFEWTMGGGWIVTVTAQLPDNGGEISQTFEFFVEAISSDSVINQHTLGESTAEANSTVQIAYAPDTDPVLTGEGSVTVTLTDADGNPITDAQVTVTGDMDHHGMVPVIGSGTHSENGQYAVPMNWTMAGDWIVTVSATLADGSSAEQVFEMVVQRAN